MWWFIFLNSVPMCVLWLVLLFQQRRLRSEGLLLQPLPADAHELQAEASLPSVCVIVPVRNVQEKLASCLQTIQAQDYPNLSILVVDDRSDDETPALAAAMCEEDSRMKLVRIRELPQGWLGKSHALWTATRQTCADWVLFVDDDCELHPSAVRTVISEALSRKVQLLSLWPRHDGRSFWEHMIIPLCGGIIAMWFKPPRKSSKSSGGAFANGQFLLMKRDAYERIGGHREIRTALIEDVVLAEHAMSQGVKSFVGSGRDLYCIRMYDGFRSAFEGWCRIFVGAIRSTPKLMTSISWLLTGSLLPFVVLPWILLLVAGSSMTIDTLPHDAKLAFVACMVQLVLMMIVSFRFWGFGYCPRIYLWLYPVSVLVVVGILAKAVFVLAIRRRIIWRDTLYRIDSNAKIACET